MYINIYGNNFINRLTGCSGAPSKILSNVLSLECILTLLILYTKYTIDINNRVLRAKILLCSCFIEIYNKSGMNKNK